jgi:hypothetical protein
MQNLGSKRLAEFKFKRLAGEPEDSSRHRDRFIQLRQNPPDVHMRNVILVPDPYSLLFKLLVQPLRERRELLIASKKIANHLPPWL